MILLAAEEAHPPHDQLYYLVPGPNLPLQKGKQFITIFFCRFLVFFGDDDGNEGLFFLFVSRHNGNEMEVSLFFLTLF